MVVLSAASKDDTTDVQWVAEWADVKDTLKADRKVEPMVVP